jgi:late competence protein required for DNA uptake (superfamily II DNA/RNA helicase)
MPLVENDISNDIRCPICQYTMRNATMLVPSGQSYCFECIFEYLSSNPNKDPITNQHYANIDLIQNYTLKSMIEKLSHAIPAEIEDNNNIIVHASIVEETSNIRVCKFGRNCKRRGCWFRHPEGQSSNLSIN